MGYTLHILRSSDIAENLAAAKAVLESMKSTERDGDFIACRYKNVTDVKDESGEVTDTVTTYKALVGIVNYAEGQDEPSLTYFEGLDPNDPNTISEELQVILDNTLNSIGLSTNTDNYGSYVEGNNDGDPILDSSESEEVTTLTGADSALSQAIQNIVEAAGVDTTAGSENYGLYGETNSDDELIGDATSLADADKMLSEYIQGLNLEDKKVAKQFVTEVTETEGQIAVTRGSVTSDVNTITITDNEDSGINVDVNIDDEDLFITKDEKGGLKTVANLAKIDDNELEGLSNSNIREAYKLTDKNGKQIGDYIYIYNDSSLKSVELVEEGNDDDGYTQYIVFTYNLESGEDAEIKLNVSDFLIQAEFKDGLQVASNGEVSIKINADKNGTNGDLVKVDENGLDFSGVQDAIDELAASSGDAEDAIKSGAGLNDDGSYTPESGDAITSGAGSLAEAISQLDQALENTKVVHASGNTHVTVTNDGNTANGVTYTVNESDIASAETVGNIIAAVGLTSDGKFVAFTGTCVGSASTIEDAIQAIINQVDTNTSNIAANKVTAADDSIVVDTSGSNTTLAVGVVDCGEY